MDAGQEAVEKILALFRQYGLPLIKGAAWRGVKLIQCGGKAAIQTPGAIAHLFKDTKTSAIQCETVEDAKLRKLAYVKCVKGVKNKDVEQVGIMLFVDDKNKNKIEKKQKKIEKYIHELKQNPIRLDEELKKMNDKNSLEIDNISVDFTSKERAIAAKKIYSEKFNEKIVCLGTSLLISKNIIKKLKNPLVRFQLNNKIDFLINNKDKFEPLVKKQSEFEEKIKNDFNKVASEIEKDTSPAISHNIRNFKEKKVSKKKDTYKSYKNVKRDPIAGSKAAANVKSNKVQTKTRGNR